MQQFEERILRSDKTVVRLHFDGQGRPEQLRIETVGGKWFILKSMSDSEGLETIYNRLKECEILIEGIE